MLYRLSYEASTGAGQLRVHNCEDHFLFYSLSAVHSYDLYRINFTSFTIRTGYQSKFSCFSHFFQYSSSFYIPCSCILSLSYSSSFYLLWTPEVLVLSFFYALSLTCFYRNPQKNPVETEDCNPVQKELRHCAY